MIQLAPRDLRYPSRLRKLTRPPDPLWVWGELPDENIPTVGIVGTRRLTPYGSRIAREIAMTLARAGAVIISGLAQGIDSTAHGGALEAGGTTVAVLGEGLAWFDDHGPLRRRELARRIRKQGALVSEYALELRGEHWTFPRRNATLAALSDALVVVEAPIQSGALITARKMRELGRPVYVVPGPLGAPTWEGAHAFVAAGEGTLLASVRQVTEPLGLQLGAPVSSRRNGPAERLLALLACAPADTDAIASELSLSSEEAAMLVAEQLIAGNIVATGDGRFARR